ncbi:MAG: glycosyltransferase family 2 protein [Deltaproteobacteria bacterium]|nr:glycosyltransferase family 2 protein [Deltaproteobacteria bacterium]
MTAAGGLVSVIIPTYNRSRLCRQAAESVLSQTYPKVEILIVDDGSQDDTRDVVSMLDDRVHYIRQDNAGVSAARNRGLLAAKGEYIAFLDSDDLWLPWKLEAQVSLLKRCPNAGMVWTDMVAVDESGTPLFEAYLRRMYEAYRSFTPEKHFSRSWDIGDVWQDCPARWRKRKCYQGDIFSWMFMGNLVHTSTVLLRRERLEKVGFFDVTLLRSGEDYDFHARTCRVGDVAFMDFPTIHYRIGAADQLTQSEHMVWIARNNLTTVLKMLDSTHGEIALPRRLFRARMASAYAWVGISEFSENRAAARRHLWKSLAWFPFQPRTAAYLFLAIMPLPFTAALISLKRNLVDALIA